MALRTISPNHETTISIVKSLSCPVPQSNKYDTNEKDMSKAWKCISTSTLNRFVFCKYTIPCNQRSYFESSKLFPCRSTSVFMPVVNGFLCHRFCARTFKGALSVVWFSTPGISEHKQLFMWSFINFSTTKYSIVHVTNLNAEYVIRPSVFEIGTEIYFNC